MDNAVGCYAYGNIFSCMAFKLYLGSSDDIPTEQIQYDARDKYVSGVAGHLTAGESAAIPTRRPGPK